MRSYAAHSLAPSGRESLTEGARLGRRPPQESTPSKSTRRPSPTAFLPKGIRMKQRAGMFELRRRQATSERIAFIAAADLHSAGWLTMLLACGQLSSDNA